MSRWDDGSFERHRYEDAITEQEEARLLRKFEDYRQLEKIEIEKRKSDKTVKEDKKEIWTVRFVLLTIFQSIIIAGYSVSLMIMEFIESEIKILILFLTMGFLGGESIFLSKYYKNNKSLSEKKLFLKTKLRTEFDRI